MYDLGNAIENRPKRDLDKPTPFHRLIDKKVKGGRENALTKIKLI